MAVNGPMIQVVVTPVRATAASIRKMEEYGVAEKAAWENIY
jgi:hypothetical protein